MAAILGVFAACKKDQLATVSASITTPVLLKPVTASTYTVNPSDSGQKVTFKWSKASYGIPAVVSYFVQADNAGTNFSKKFSIGTSSSDSLSMTLGTLNTKLLAGLNLAVNASSQIEVRVGACIYGKDTVYSSAIKLTFGTYKELAPAQLYVPGAYQGWDPGSALSIPQVTTYTYEGYIYMNVGDQFKFTNAPDWNHTNYGDAGNGKLTTDGLAGGVSVSAPGYYKLNADIQNLTWSASLINTFGIIGTATPQQWNASTPMTFSTTTKLWKITLNLVPGALKFRANDDWGINYGPADVNALTGTLIQTNDAITVVNAGNYTVTIDMSQSTANQKKYVYTVVKN